ncbi:MAG: hypothetical protein L0Y66_13800 [Myxococcaceae bacterium]|nr:hypothetical protein [Myxococcaceae bacterium]MCI0669462.1 hypothetical protein [Myxococcaceae bacterium]
MRTTHALILLLAGVLATAGCTCGSGGTPDGGGDTDQLRSLTLTPADAVLTISSSTPATAQYTVTGTYSDGHTGDLTAQAQLTLDNVALGSFAGRNFTSNTVRGGNTVVRAQVGAVSGETSLTLKLQQQLSESTPGGTPPSNPGGKFGGTVDAARAPTLVYPNSGVMVPPNLGRLEIHFRKRHASNTLFELAFTNATTDVRVYVRCPPPASATPPATPPSGVTDGCIYMPSTQVWNYVAESNRGGEPVQLTLRATDDSGTAVGVSAPITLQFSRSDLRGALYYWTTSGGTAVMRYDFAGPAAASAEPAMTPSNIDASVNCVGCHALSRNGKKVVAEVQGQNDGRIALMDLSTATPTTKVPLLDNGAKKSIFESWNPDGSQFVGVYGDSGATNYNLLLFNGNTGASAGDIAGTGTSSNPANHPDWSADDKHIAYVKVGVKGTNQRMGKGAVMLLSRNTSGAWATPITVAPAVSGKNRYYPAIAPDSSFLIFNESTCPSGENHTKCNADSDPTAKLVAARLVADAPPVPLTRANTPGLVDEVNPHADGVSALTNSYPKWSPFVQQGNGGPGSRLMWVTFSSSRMYGLRQPPAGGTENPRGTLVWMAAVDPDKVAAGLDPSHAAFALPFQELDTSNHIAQWAQYLVTGGCATEGEGCTTGGGCCNGLQCVGPSDPPVPCDVAGACVCRPIPECTAEGQSCTSSGGCCDGLTCQDASGASCTGGACTCKPPCAGIGQSCGGASGGACCPGLLCNPTSSKCINPIG